MGDVHRGDRTQEARRDGARSGQRTVPRDKPVEVEYSSGQKLEAASSCQGYQRRSHPVCDLAGESGASGYTWTCIVGRRRI